MGECAACPYRRSEPLAREQGERWTAYQGDSIVILRALADKSPQSVDAIISDPPYGTGANTIAGRLASPLLKYRTTGAKVMPSIAGDAMLPEAWAEMMSQVASRCLRLAKPGANLLFFCDWRGYPMLLRILGAVGWGIRGLLVWDKGRGARPSKNGFRAQSELIIWARNGGVQDRDKDVYLDGVFRHASPQRVHHLTEKPVSLMRELVEICPEGGLVLDPFQGSGTVGIAALLSGRRYIGIETIDEYHRIACERLAEAEHGAP
jgi:site-specific DNA-methyltransferase (adenine-specific)